MTSLAVLPSNVERNKNRHPDDVPESSITLRL